MKSDLNHAFQFRKEPLVINKNKSEYFQHYIPNDSLDQYRLSVDYAAGHASSLPPIQPRNHIKTFDIDDRVMYMTLT